MQCAPQFRSRYRTLTLSLCLCAVLFSTRLHAQAPSFADPVDDATHVLDLIERRLSLMPEVAAWKWRAQQPVIDEQRERQVLEQSVAAAEAIGLDGSSARSFFAVQILMARNVQTHYIDRWRTQNPAQIPVGRELATELRPELDAIGRDLLTAVYVASAGLPQALQDQRVLDRLREMKQYGGIDDAQLLELRSALATIHISRPASLSSIKRVGVLRVGSTGDYAPFSNEHEKRLTGFDIDLAMRMAQHLGVSVKFVRTTWPTLMEDFKQHRFDVAMSGISITPDRASHAVFSVPYHVDGKTPIARCADKAKFGTLEQIDRPGVRVIENPGGTNERFAREHVKQAAITIHSDNRTVFERILTNQADIMFTDGIEVDLQVRRHPELCRTMPVPLTEASKAIMLPNREWENAVNAWLQPQVKSGQVRVGLERALVQAE